MTKVTLKDIADQVGISQQTVSKVLNKRNFTVSTATKRKILATARKLNYRPNLFAQSLKTGRTNMIGVATQTIIALTVAQNVIALVITSSPGPISVASMERCKAAVHEFNATVCVAPLNRAKSFSNS